MRNRPHWEKRYMRRACCFALFTAILASGTGLAQTSKFSKSSKPAVRQERAPPPVATAGAAAGTAHPSPYNFPGVQFPRIEADNRVSFSFTAPNAQNVQVGLVTPGQNSLQPLPVDMVKGPDGVWTYNDHRAPKPRLPQLLDVRGRRDRAGPRHAGVHRLWPHVQWLRSPRAGRGLVRPEGRPARQRAD